MQTATPQGGVGGEVGGVLGGVLGGGVHLPLLLLVLLLLLLLAPQPFPDLEDPSLSLSLCRFLAITKLWSISMDIEKDKSPSNSNSAATVVACSWDAVASDEDTARSHMCFGAVETWPLAGSRIAVAAARTKQKVTVMTLMICSIGDSVADSMLP